MIENCKIDNDNFSSMNINNLYSNTNRYSAFTVVKPKISPNLNLPPLTYEELALRSRFNYTESDYIFILLNNRLSNAYAKKQCIDYTPLNSVVKFMDEDKTTTMDTDLLNQECNISEFIQNLEVPNKKCKSEFVNQNNNDSSTNSYPDISMTPDFGPSKGKLQYGEIGTTMNSDGNIQTSSNDFNDHKLQNDCIQVKKVGFYTKEERQLKIKKYRLKIKKWRRGEHKNKDRYIKRRIIAQDKPRIGGRFVKNIICS